MNTSRSLEQLEADPWPAPPVDATGMVQRCHELRKIPIEKLSAGDYRVLIGQGIGVRYLVPLALAIVGTNPLVEGDYYPGDLLVTLFNIDGPYWEQHPDHLGMLNDAAQRAREIVENLDDPLGSDKRLLKDINAYLVRRAA